MNRAAFTLIELLIVVAIIGILAAIAVPNFLNAQHRARLSRTYADMKALMIAFDSYAIDNGMHYPPDDNSGVLPDPGESGTYNRLTTPVAYIGSIPHDTWLTEKTHSSETMYQLADNLRYFEYWGKFSKDEYRVKKWTEQGLFYLMRSLGPDLIRQMESGNIYQIFRGGNRRISYNNSNGLNSRGDIIASNRGFE
ncbi:MAG: prepilin-type N-terminal cleavage/methylation domain-containing protein [bacterium]